MDSKIKILIGILAIGIVLIGGWWIWNNRPSESVPGEEIYDGKGETITFRIDNTVKICTNGLPFSIIKSSGESVELKHSCMGFVGSGFDQYCENGKIVSKPLHQLCDFSEKWCRGCSDVLTCRDEPIHETFVWDQKEYVEITEECEGKTIHREILKQVPEGKYKIVVYDINGNEKVINEFTIKEKTGDGEFCQGDTDCVPAQCCHPTSCVNREFSPDCSGIGCTAVCQGPIDCGAGECICRDNRCVVESIRIW